jgi:hypothetical protein
MAVSHPVPQFVCGRESLSPSSSICVDGNNGVICIANDSRLATGQSLVDNCRAAILRNRFDIDIRRLGNSKLFDDVIRRHAGRVHLVVGEAGISSKPRIFSGTTNVEIKGLTDEGDCPQRDGAFFKCRAGWSAWTWSRQGDYIVATFKNWSHDRARNATLRVYGTKLPLWPQTLFETEPSTGGLKCGCLFPGLRHLGSRKSEKWIDVVFVCIESA